MKAILSFFKNNTLGILLCAVIAVIATIISGFIPMHLISGGVFALLLGMLLNPLLKKTKVFNGGLNFTSKKLLKLAIILMGITLSVNQILYVGGYSLIVMTFTLAAAFGFGWLFGRIFKMQWKLSSLISAGTGICGGSAIAAISPVINAKDSDVAYAIAATFIFDVVMVIVFPLIGKAIGMSDLGYGLWAGTAVNDTSSVVAAGFAFSDAAGNFAIIVKLTRTLSIIPVVIIFSLINTRIERKAALAAVNSPSDRTSLCSGVSPIKTNSAVLDRVKGAKAADTSANSDSASNESAVSELSLCNAPLNDESVKNNSALYSLDGGKGSDDALTENISNSALLGAVDAVSDVSFVADVSPADVKKKKRRHLLKIFPWFILGFLAMVAVKTIGFVPAAAENFIASASKFFMVMALGAIGLKTNLKEMKTSGFKPMLHGFIISLLVVLVAFGVQAMLGQI